MRYLLTFLLLAPACGGQAFAQAPTGAQAPPSKILTLTPQEEQALVGTNGILDTAQQGRPLDLTGTVQYFRNKIREAPASGGQAPPSAGEPKAEQK